MKFADAKQRFSSRVADYVRYRPGYPAALLDILRRECGLTPSAPIADIGSGTGFLAELFLKNGNRVYGVEPNAEMRAAGEEYLAQFPKFTSVAGSAEATTLADSSVQFVSAAQAFHWFEPNAARKEFARILTPGGWVVVVWNTRRVSDTACAREYEDLLVRYGTDYTHVKESYPETHDMANFFGEGNFQTRELPNSQQFDLDGLRGRLRSSSYAPQEDHPKFTPMMEELQTIFERYQEKGRVNMDYVTRIYFGRLNGTSR